MDFSLVVALAPALACSMMCVLVEGPPLWRKLRKGWRTFVLRLAKNETLLELLAETTVHLSTYGSVLVGWLIHHLVDHEVGYVFTALVALHWFAVMHWLSYWLRELLKDLRD